VVERNRCVGLAYRVDLYAGLSAIGWTKPVPLGRLCRRPPPVVDRTTVRRAVAVVMIEQQTDALVVLDDEVVVGVLTAIDLVRSLATHG
jgi:CBS domain-containing protein